VDEGDWKGGRVEGWKGGRVEGWKIGRMEGWKVEGGRMGCSFSDGNGPPVLPNLQLTTLFLYRDTRKDGKDGRM
jgi:hypothetical protein